MQATYCVSCKKMTRNTNPKVSKTQNERLMLKSICSVCGNKNKIFVKKIEDLVYYHLYGLKHPYQKYLG